MISWEDFQKVDMRVGTVVSASPFEQAKKPAYILSIDFGELGTMKSSAQITDLYNLEELVGRQVIAVVNFPPKQIANIMSECLVLGVYSNGGEVTLLSPDTSVDNGRRIG